MKQIACLSKVILNSIVAFLFGALCYYSIGLWFWGLAAIFGVLFLIYFGIIVLYVGIIHITEEGVRLTLFGRTIRSQSWDDIEEVCVLGTKIGPSMRKNPGTLFYCFFTEKQNEDSRFSVALRWPPFFRYTYVEHTDKTELAILKYWPDEIKTCNIGSAQVQTNKKTPEAYEE